MQEYPHSWANLHSKPFLQTWLDPRGSHNRRHLRPKAMARAESRVVQCPETNVFNSLHLILIFSIFLKNIIITLILKTSALSINQSIKQSIN